MDKQAQKLLNEVTADVAKLRPHASWLLALGLLELIDCGGEMPAGFTDGFGDDAMLVWAWFDEMYTAASSPRALKCVAMMLLQENFLHDGDQDVGLGN